MVREGPPRKGYGRQDLNDVAGMWATHSTQNRNSVHGCEINEMEGKRSHAKWWEGKESRYSEQPSKGPEQERAWVSADGPADASVAKANRERGAKQQWG